jgi:transposase
MRERAARRLLGVLGGVVLAASACGTTALTSSNGAATEPNAPRWQKKKKRKRRHKEKRKREKNKTIKGIG